MSPVRERGVKGAIDGEQTVGPGGRWYWAAEVDLPTQRIWIDPEETRHLRTVLRHRAADSIEVIDGRGGPPLSPAMLRVEGERIAQVGARVEIPAGARVIDLGDATLLPGLIDLHTHLTDKFGVHWEDALLTTTPSQAALWGARNARDTLRAGFTTCRDMGPTWPYVDVDLRDAIAAGAVPGPRLLVAGNYVSSTGGAG